MEGMDSDIRESLWLKGCPSSFLVTGTHWQVHLESGLSYINGLGRYYV
jgi:hypothetical protein